ncbi:protein phosphatase 1H-like isoform X2 [Salvelinus fontinalis]|uniref:protein phosphatase 1H-like isoform X2 n=1 Tax=Salvelinus fontinalis TaxID=8038 RepID=UPI002485C58D|nr:protein phosphatase 1H-like isoform X2 [Salvelinus fontinalis]
MLTRMKSAVANFMGGMMAGSSNVDHFGGPDLPLKYPYTRPEFLGLSPDEIECSADHISRPILILKDTKRLPWATGYAEVINAGKSLLNEDQACCEVVLVRRRLSAGGNSTPNMTPTTRRRSSLPNGEGLGIREDSDAVPGLIFHYWGLFDGHAGSGAAVVASKLLQHHIVEHLREVLDVLRNTAQLVPIIHGEEPTNLTPTTHRGITRTASLRGAAGAPGSPSHPPPTRFFTEKKVRHESLVMGAIENAFKEMDAQIERDKAVFNVSGGCTALCALFLLGKLYVGNAGDSRAIIIRGGEVIPMSTEFTPESERQRLQFLAYMQPHLLGGEFTHLEFPRRVQRKEVGKRMLYRDFTMSGWAYKTIEDDDLKFPLIYGEGKKVKVYPLTQYEHGADDVLVMGTDGLWDVLSNQEVTEAVTCFLANCDPDDQHRYTMAAQDLVMRARGVLKDRGWRIANDRLGSGDDISVYIICLMYGNRQT